jgi:EAL domain-containing protein (putative c-di-GMP-specific phosphodiesterase class I)
MAYVSASVGITLFPNDAMEVEDLIKNADQAMYSAKQEGKNRYHFFTPSMQEMAMKRMRIINDLRRALENDEFEIVYQPIVELASGVIKKAEALIRWHHPTKGLINPIDFISAAEDTGMISSFGNWVFHGAAIQAAIWREKYHPAFQISVNISPVQFKKDGIDSSAWLNHLGALGIPGQGIVVEITEGLLLEVNSKVTDQLLTLRDAGIEVSLDDFGTGYSSLSYLKKFDIDYLKIDQSFVKNMAEGSDDMALCEAIIVMAHKLGIRVIAEGVETKRQHELLANAGCDFAQGYVFSKPVSAAALEELLTSDPFALQEELNI